MHLLHRYLSVSLAAILPVLAAGPTAAQTGKHILKAATASPRTAAIAAQAERQVAKFTYDAALVGQVPYLLETKHLGQNILPPVQNLPENAPQGVSLVNAKGEVKGKHSIVPSALTILGSDAFKSAEAMRIKKLRREEKNKRIAEYLPPQERAYWTSEREELGRIWRLQNPTPLSELDQYLTHPVPPDTWAYLRESYVEYVKTAQQINHEVTAKLVYSSLVNEGRRLQLQEVVYINKIIMDMRSKTSILRSGFVKDPYLLNQQKYWDRVLGTFNPLLQGLLVKLDIPRPDKRTYDYHEFTLANPDHTTPYLPDSHSLIREEEDDDLDYDDETPLISLTPAQRMAKREAERAHTEHMMGFVQEADELLPFIPENLHIAFINDDANPRFNFEGWAKRGMLGKGATVQTYKEGKSFLNDMSQGVKYDLVITDLLVRDGGVVMMEKLREMAPFLPVIALSKFYPGEGDALKTDSGKEVVTAKDYFHAGFDGYMWYNNNLDSGGWGFIQYLRSMKNYYYYKNLHGWNR